ncbi:MAG: cytochrome d ubiquinol oxidase subunit II [Deltaproteobacteria bacterium]|nr:cytochrome d ubiquinol oxidase subunit II [Deltaproteobacteria bacterium]
MMEPSALQVLWLVLFGVLVAGYAVLDGFDLGVGVLSLFRKDKDDRRLMINAIGPVWDGNEVWLLTAGGALFAAFTPVYATVFSGFYMALMLLLAALIFRAVSMEFRGKVESDRWCRLWDLGFGLGSLLPAILFGVAVGNIMRGIPLDADGNFAGTFFSLLNPYALATGLLSLAAFVCHGAIYMGMKSDGVLRESMRKVASRAWIGWVTLYVGATVGTFFAAPHLFEGVLNNPLTWVAFLAQLVALIFVPVAVKSDKLGRAFVASAAALVAMIGLVGIGLFPNLVPALGEPAASLTIATHSSTERALSTMTVIAGIGMPIVLTYTVFIYKTFKGKVQIGEDSY